jgi:hypothetical protein
MSQAVSRGDASLAVPDDLTADECARARTVAPGGRCAARRQRATPAPDPLALRHCRSADRGRLRGEPASLVAVWTHIEVSDTVETRR